MTVASLATWRNYTELPVHASSVSIARRHVARLLTGWGCVALIHDARLVASELVTNGIKAAAGDHRVWLGLHHTSFGIVLEVWDPSRHPPKLLNPGVGELGGRGLQVVNELAISWGCRWPSTGGKIVWALLGEAS